MGTYNVNGRRPPDKLDLRPWLDVTQHEPAIVAVGLQEVVPLSTTNVVMGELGCSQHSNMRELAVKWLLRGIKAPPASIGSQGPT